MANILISGASGLIGQALVSTFNSRGDEVFRLVRRPPRDEHDVQWNPERAVSPEIVSGFDAVIHLSGESVSGRWTKAKKQRIRDSRVVSTTNLSNALAQAEKPPRTFICASAIGYYGNRGDEVLTEESASGSGFLAEVSREWEAAAQPAVNAGIRVANIRIGIVLSRDGGALQQMLLPFRLGLGGKLGSGRQWFSWIHTDDLVAAVLHIMDGVAPPFPRPLREGGDLDVITQSHGLVERRALSLGLLRGPVNMVSSNPVTNAEFTKTLATVLQRPAFFAVPAFAARIAFGEFADAGLLSSAKVVPKKLSENGFTFHYSELGPALQELLGTDGSAALSAPR
jgi:uncharacterized protein (TIGR01777 family)